LLSRCVLLTLQPLDDDAVRALVRRALADGRGLAGAFTLAGDAEDHLVRLAGGDVRKAVTALEGAALRPRRGRALRRRQRVHQEHAGFRCGRRPALPRPDDPRR
jgi:replication-associated recombination protein RarA